MVRALALLHCFPLFSAERWCQDTVIDTASPCLARDTAGRGCRLPVTVAQLVDEDASNQVSHACHRHQAHGKAFARCLTAA